MSPTLSQPIRNETNGPTSSVNSNVNSPGGTLSEPKRTVTSIPNKVEMVGNNRRWDHEVKRRLVTWFRSRQHLPEDEVESQFKSSFEDTRSYSAILSAYYQMGGSLRKQKKRDTRQKKIVTRKNDAQVASQPEETSASPESLPQARSPFRGVSKSSVYYPGPPNNLGDKQPPVQESEELGWSVERRPTGSDSDHSRNVMDEEPLNGLLSVPDEFQSENSCGDSLPASAVEASPPRVLSNVSGLPGQGGIGDYNDRAPQNTEPDHPHESPSGMSQPTNSGQIPPIHSEKTSDQRSKLFNSAQLTAVNYSPPNMHDLNTGWAEMGIQHHRLPSFADILNLSFYPNLEEQSDGSMGATAKMALQKRHRKPADDAAQ